MHATNVASLKLFHGHRLPAYCAGSHDFNNRRRILERQ